MPSDREAYACASILQGIVGFGNALVATPLALIFLDKETVVSSMVLVGIALSGFLVARIRERTNYRPVVFLAALVGDRIAARVPQRPFRILALAALFVVGMYSIVSGLT